MNNDKPNDNPKDETQTSEAQGKFWRVLHVIWQAMRVYVWPILFLIVKTVLILLWRLAKQLWKFIRVVAVPAVKAGYFRIPPKRRLPVLSAFLLVVLLIGFACTMLMTSGIPFLMRDSASLETAQSEHIADMKLLSGTWEEQKQAAKEALLAAGFEVPEGSDEPGGDRPFVIPPELTMIAHDAGRKAEGGGRLTLTQFADMMRDFGFPFEEGKDHVKLLQSGIRHWVRFAESDPSLPGAAAPLFLNDMAKAQVPQVDLASDNWLPDDYRMTYIEMQVFLGAFFQALPDEPEAEIGLLDRLFGTQTAYAADELTACSYAKKWFTDWGKKNDAEEVVNFDVDLVTLLTAELTGKGMEYIGELLDQGIAAVMSKITGVSKQVAAIAGKALQVISLLTKLQKLAFLYHSVEVTVTPTPSIPHMPGPEDQAEEVQFKAVAGVNDKVYAEFLKQWNASSVAKNIKDCMSLAGLPTLTDSADLAADVENWSIEWKLLQGENQLVTWGPEKNKFEYAGQQQMKLTKTGPNKGEAVFTVDLVREKVNKHKGTDKIGTVVMKASVETTGMPPILSQLVNAGKVAGSGDSIVESALWGLLGIVDTLADIVMGWYQSLVKPEGFGYLHVTYHVPSEAVYSYDGWIRAERTENYSKQEAGVDEQWDKSLKAEWQVISDYMKYNSAPRIKGTGTGHGMYQYSYLAEGANECGGFGAGPNGIVRGRSTGEASAQAIEDIESDGVLKREGNDQDGYIFSITAFGGGVRLDYTEERTKTQSPSGCQFVQPVSRAWSVEGSTSVDVTMTQGLITHSKEAYPEVLSGRQVDIDELGGKTVWTWELKRIEHESQSSIRPEFEFKGPVGG